MTQFHMEDTEFVYNRLGYMTCKSIRDIHYIICHYEKVSHYFCTTFSISIESLKELHIWHSL